MVDVCDMVSAVQTTCVGAWTEGAVKNWFTEEEDGRRMMGRAWRPQLREETNAVTAARVQAKVKEVVEKQVNLGLDIVTDGEVGRENYFLHFVRNGVVGIDLKVLSDKVMRDGAFVSKVPTVVGRLAPSPEPWCYKEFLAAQAVSAVPVRYTLPGPMTMMDGCYNAHYSDPHQLAADLVVILQREVLALAAHGCRHIQLDEPVLMRYPEQALETGVANIAAVFRGCPAQVERAVHLCCGYPDRLEPTDYHKADPANYPAILQALDQAGMDWATIEHAEPQTSDLSYLAGLERLGLVLGVTAIARTRVESAAEMAGRARAALHHLPPSRVMLAPDCGLGFLPPDIATAKLSNMVTAARILNAETDKLS